MKKQIPLMPFIGRVIGYDSNFNELFRERGEFISVNHVEWKAAQKGCAMFSFFPEIQLKNQPIIFARKIKIQ